MVQPLPMLPVSQDQLQQLIAVMLIYRRFRLEKTPPTEERSRTLLLLAFLLPKLCGGVGVHEEAAPIWLTVDEVSVLKAGLAAIFDALKKKAASRKVTEELERVNQLKIVIEQTFSTTQD